MHVYLWETRKKLLEVKSAATTISVDHRRNVGTEIKFYMKKEISWESVNDNLQAHYHLNSPTEVHKSMFHEEDCILILIQRLQLYTVRNIEERYKKKGKFIS